MRPGCGIDCTRKEDYLSGQDFAAVRAPPQRALVGMGLACSRVLCGCRL